MNLSPCEYQEWLDRIAGPAPEARFQMLRAQIAAQLFVDSIRTEVGAREAVEEADMLLKELLK